MNQAQIAEACHEMNRLWCRSLGDDSQPRWEDAPEWQRESAILGVRFRIENPSSLPSDSHDMWMAEKRKAGWVWGPEKNPEKKEHPCMVLYHELPPEQRAKDYIFLSIVDMMLDVMRVVNERG